MKLLTILAFLFAPLAMYASDITFDSPQGGFSTKRVVQIKGTVKNFRADRCTLVINGVPQTMQLTSSGGFSVNTVPAPGLNTIEVRAGESSKVVSYYANVPGKDIKVLLTWDTPTDVDLWVIDPKGNKCYYANRSTPTGGNLDTDVTTGYGPETFTMAKAQPGPYSVEVQYYSSGSAPLTRVKVFVILYEGTPREERKTFEFTMTKEYRVYHLADFNIEGE